MVHGIDYNISGTNYDELIFYTFYTSITPNYTVSDHYFISYKGYLTEEINLVDNMILEVLDKYGIWRPIAKVPLTPTGDFDYTFLIGEGGLQFPLKEEHIMRLVYLPTNLSNYNNEYLAVDYSNIDCVYNTSSETETLFRLYVEGMESNLEYEPTDFSETFDRWAVIDEREYITTTSPYETLHVGEPFTYLDFHRTVTDDYEFTFQLTDKKGNYLEDQVVWMEVGWKPKAGLNYKVIDWENEDGEYINSEALGTAWFMDEGQEVCRGPGISEDDYDYSISRMFTRPETWSYFDVKENEVGQYSSYFWDYQITDKMGHVTFNLTFDEDFIADHHIIFDESMFSSGSITFDELEDYRLYMRVFHAPIYEIGHMAFNNASELYCSKDNNVFDFSRVSEFDDLNYKDTTFFKGSYAEGLLTLHPEDIMLGVPDLLVYQYGSELNDTFSFKVEVAEADPIPDTEMMTLGKLENSFDADKLVPEFINHSYLIEGMPLYATITTYNGESHFSQGHVEFGANVDQEGVATFTIDDLYMKQLIPGVYRVAIYTVPRIYTKEAYRFCTLEVRPENWLKFGEPTITLDLLNWFDSGWGGAYFGDDYAFYEDIYPRLTGYLATLHSTEGIGDYVEFSVYAKARNISDTTDWSEFEWIPIGDEEVYISSLVYDGLYYFEYPLGQDGDMLMGSEILLNITVDATYNQTGMIEDNREQKLYILNLTLMSSSIRDDATVFRKYIGPIGNPIWINSTPTYGVERYFEYTTDEDTYGIDADDILLNLRGYQNIQIVEVRGVKKYDEVVIPVENYTIQGDNYTIILSSGTTLDNYSDVIISYAIRVDSQEVMQFTFSEAAGFTHDSIILNTYSRPIALDHSNDAYLGEFYSKFNESYGLTNKEATLNVGFEGIETDDVKIFTVTDMNGQPISDTYSLTDLENQIKITFEPTTPDNLYIEYGIYTYKLDRGYQRIGMNMSDAVRKLTNRHGDHKIVNYTADPDVELNLLTIPDDPQDPLEAGEPKILIPLLEDNKTSISFNYLALLYDSVLNGSFYLDDCILAGDVNNLKPVLATFTFTTEDGESYFDYVKIDPTTGKNKFDFEISLQPVYAVKGYTTYDVEIDFLSYGDNPHTIQYILFDKFELTADDRILQIVDKPMLTKDGELDISTVINTGHYAQIFTDRLTEAYGVVNNSWLTIAAEGFNGYGQLMMLSKEDQELVYELVENNEHYFKCLEDDDYRLTDSLGFHINAYDLELPEYIEGEINLYAGIGTHTYGEVFEEKQFSMNWDSTGYSDYTVKLDTFTDQYTYNAENFKLSELPLTSDYMSVEGELYLHHLIDLNTPANIIYPSGAQFGVIIPNSTDRISSLNIKYIDRIARPWDWVESWQGYSLTNDDFEDHVYNPGNAIVYNPSQPPYTLTEGSEYELVITESGENQIHFYISDTQVKNLLSSDVIQIDFHVDYEFTEFDFIINEPSNTYDSTLHWQFPDDLCQEWRHFKYHPDLTSTAAFNASFFHISEYASKNDFKSSTTEELQFYPNEYNFTTIEFTGFNDAAYEITLNLTDGGDFGYIIDTQDWDRIQPFGITVQTSSGERYLDDNFIRSWQHDSEYEDEPIFTFYLARYDFDDLNILNDTEILLTYYYLKESLSYFTQNRILYDGDTYNHLIIKNSRGMTILSFGNVSSIEGNNITFTDNVITEDLLRIGESFTIEYEFKTKGGLLDTKHLFIEVQPWEMKFYNNYYPFSGGSIISALYYNLSANYQYQLALNYRLQEKGMLSFEFEADTTKDTNVFDLGANDPLHDFDEWLAEQFISAIMTVIYIFYMIGMAIIKLFAAVIRFIGEILMAVLSFLGPLLWLIIRAVLLVLIYIFLALEILTTIGMITVLGLSLMAFGGLFGVTYAWGVNPIVLYAVDTKVGFLELHSQDTDVKLESWIKWTYWAYFDLYIPVPHMDFDIGDLFDRLESENGPPKVLSGFNETNNLEYDFYTTYSDDGGDPPEYVKVWLIPPKGDINDAISYVMQRHPDYDEYDFNDGDVEKNFYKTGVKYNVTIDFATEFTQSEREGQWFYYFEAKDDPSEGVGTVVYWPTTTRFEVGPNLIGASQVGDYLIYSGIEPLDGIVWEQDILNFTVTGLEVDSGVVPDKVDLTILFPDGTFQTFAMTNISAFKDEYEESTYYSRWFTKYFVSLNLSDYYDFNRINSYVGYYFNATLNNGKNSILLGNMYSSYAEESIKTFYNVFIKAIEKDGKPKIITYKVEELTDSRYWTYEDTRDYPSGRYSTIQPFYSEDFLRFWVWIRDEDGTHDETYGQTPNNFTFTPQLTLTKIRGENFTLDMAWAGYDDDMDADMYYVDLSGWGDYSYEWNVDEETGEGDWNETIFGSGTWRFEFDVEDNDANQAETLYSNHRIWHFGSASHFWETFWGGGLTSSSAPSWLQSFGMIRPIITVGGFLLSVGLQSFGKRSGDIKYQIASMLTSIATLGFDAGTKMIAIASMIEEEDSGALFGVSLNLLITVLMTTLATSFMGLRDWKLGSMSSIFGFFNAKRNAVFSKFIAVFRIVAVLNYIFALINNPRALFGASMLLMFALMGGLSGLSGVGKSILIMLPFAMSFGAIFGDLAGIDLDENWAGDMIQPFLDGIAHFASLPWQIIALILESLGIGVLLSYVGEQKPGIGKGKEFYKFDQFEPATTGLMTFSIFNTMLATFCLAQFLSISGLFHSILGFRFDTVHSDNLVVIEGELYLI